MQLDIGEKAEDALAREMREEVTLDVQIESPLGVYSDPLRDERFNTASVVYICKAIGTPKAADDAKKVFVFKEDEIPLEELVFDHKKIIEDFLEKQYRFQRNKSLFYRDNSLI